MSNLDSSHNDTRVIEKGINSWIKSFIGKVVSGLFTKQPAASIPSTTRQNTKVAARSNGPLGSLMKVAERPDYSETSNAQDTNKDVIDDGGSEKSLPIIVINDRRLQDITADAYHALLRANRPPVLFQNAGRIVRILHDENHNPRIEGIDDYSLTYQLERSALFVKQFSSDKGPTLRVANPPKNVVKDILARGDFGDLPALEAISRCPYPTPDGDIVCTPGYNPKTKLFLSLDPGLGKITVPTNPTKRELIDAYSKVMDLLDDFPFVDEASKANLIAMMFTAVLRPAIDGNIPLGLIRATKAGTGKSLLTELIMIIATGSGSNMMSPPKTEEEFIKTIISILAQGIQIVAIDNVDGMLDSPNLTGLLTSGFYQGRLLGTNKMGQFKNVSMWIANGNNIQVGNDLSRRTIPIFLDAKSSEPWTRAVFKHGNIKAYALQHRAEIIQAILTLTKGWFAAGTPKADVKTMGNFEEWSHIIGGVLQNAGIKGFLQNTGNPQASVDIESDEWDTFLSAIYENMRDEPFTISELFGKFIDGSILLELIPSSVLSNFSHRMLDDDEKKKAIGTAFARKNGTRYGNPAVWLVKQGKRDRSGVNKWRVMRE